MCYNSTTNGSCPAGFVTYNTALSATVAVSVWANTNAAVVFSTAGATGSSFKVTFAVNNWAQNAAAWASPTTPSAAPAPNTPAGAKALAASAAAAAAVAAALY